jgi:hypothetical protein
MLPIFYKKATAEIQLSPSIESKGQAAFSKSQVSAMSQAINQEPESKLERRSFIRGAIYTLTSLIGGTLAASVGTYLLGTPQVETDSWADAGDISELRPGSPQELTFERSREDCWKIHNEKASAWVILDNERKVTAFSPLCTHLGCAYKWCKAPPAGRLIVMRLSSRAPDFGSVLFKIHDRRRLCDACSRKRVTG